MAKIWLRSNRRVLLLAFMPAMGIGLAGALTLRGAAGSVGTLLGGGLLAVAGVLCWGLIGQLRRPRIGFDGSNVLFYVRANSPVAIPVERVEAFFLGQGPAHLPTRLGAGEKSVNLVARLSQKFPELASGEVREAFGDWADHYLTVRGAWCETLHLEKVRFLNQQLHREQQEQRGAAPPTPPRESRRS